MELKQKTVIELPVERFEQLEETSQKILNALQNFKILPKPDYFTVEEFCEKIKASRWKFEKLRSEHGLKTFKRGRKIYIPAEEVDRYFENNLVIQ
jgi:excisionase family DNA binding protein